MALYTVKVNKLNKRQGPVSNFKDKSNVAGEVSKGAPIEIVAEITNTLGKWLQDNEGKYYWSEGLKKGPMDLILDYNSKSPLPLEVRNTKGKNVLIGVLDTGCYQHPAFKKHSMRGKNFIDGSDNYQDSSNISHGTFVSGIIAAGECEESKMKGVAPDVSFVIAKITTQKGISNRQAVLEGLKWLIEQKPDIINCSIDFSPSIDQDKFDKVFDSPESKAIIWVGAGQDRRGILNDIIYYPASNLNFLTVGSLSVEHLTNEEIPLINAKFNYLVPQFAFTSTDKYETYSDQKGSSFASAYLTGNLALIKSFLKQKEPNISPKKCIDFLNNHINSFTSSEQLIDPMVIVKI